MTRFIGMMVAGMLALGAGSALASHGTAPVGDAIDGDGFGIFLGAYTQSASDHPWYTFNATAGQSIFINLTTNYGNGSYLWLYEVLDGVAEIGDADGGALSLVAQSSNTDTLPGPFDDQSIAYIAGNTNQYIVQVDSWLGGDGNYTLEIAGRIGQVPAPAPLLLLAAGLLWLGARRRAA